MREIWRFFWKLRVGDGNAHQRAHREPEADGEGGENLWICDLEGKNARQITFEKEQVISGPAWSPNGNYLAARKRFTDVSIIGVTELWLYHLKGGRGFSSPRRKLSPTWRTRSFRKMAGTCIFRQGRAVIGTTAM